MRVRSGSVDTTGTTGSKYCGFRLNVNHFTIFDVHGDNTDYGSILVFNDIDRKPFVQEYRVIFNVALIQGV